MPNGPGDRENWDQSLVEPCLQFISNEMHRLNSQVVRRGLISEGWRDGNRHEAIFLLLKNKSTKKMFENQDSKKNLKTFTTLVFHQRFLIPNSILLQLIFSSFFPIFCLLIGIYIKKNLKHCFTTSLWQSPKYYIVAPR